MRPDGGSPRALRLDPRDGFPNSPLPALLYRNLPAAGDAGRAEEAFAGHGWLGAWRDGIFGFDHFHSNAHEVLAVVAGEVQVGLGGPGGVRVTARAGDILVLPAGTAHRNLGQSGPLLVVGAYPDGMPWDLRRGDPAELEEVRANIASVPLPRADPVYGPGGPLCDLWSTAQPAAPDARG